MLKGLPKEVILYQYEVCPFCCKTKAVLDYYKVSCSASALASAPKLDLCRLTVHPEVLSQTIAVLTAAELTCKTSAG